MKGSSEHEEIIARELIHARMEFTVVDQAAGFADYEERKDHPVAGKIAKTRRPWW